IVDAHTVLWVDLGGSGIETIAHLRENGRITLMFCAFEGRANILRIYGQGEAVTMDDPGFDALLALFPKFERARAIVKINISSVSDSCGWGVPFYEFKEDREQLNRYIEHQSLETWKQHRYEGNGQSIDGLPGLRRPDLKDKAQSS
ncbi:MAG: pyridoxamine 5'-phosphate oxidase family protein, partial [Flavobacteriaceae bacterium]|nr:pyridoxamine 5'-phosphate oxidase family protein [Flavobacteriaceae bacterium]